MCRAPDRKLLRGDLRMRTLLLGLVCLLGLGSKASAADWPQWFGPERDGVWHETGLVEKYPSGGPRILWRATLGTGYSGPSVAKGRVYVLDRQRAKNKEG